MAEVRRIGDLEINFDHEFEKRQWRIERIGWLFMSLIVFAGLLGLFGGSGLLSTATVGDESRLQVNYLRFTSMLEPSELRVYVRPNPDDEEARLSINQQYLDRFEITGIEPEPERVERSSSGNTYVFTLAESGVPATIIFHVRSQHIGVAQGQVSVGETDWVEFSQFVYP